MSKRFLVIAGGIAVVVLGSAAGIMSATNAVPSHGVSAQAPITGSVSNWCGMTWQTSDDNFAPPINTLATASSVQFLNHCQHATFVARFTSEVYTGLGALTVRSKATCLEPVHGSASATRAKSSSGNRAAGAPSSSRPIHRRLRRATL